LKDKYYWESRRVAKERVDPRRGYPYKRPLTKNDLLYIALKYTIINKIHIVDPSPWPIIVRVSVTGLAIRYVEFVHGEPYALIIFSQSALLLTIALWSWWRNVIQEGSYIGCHTALVQHGFRVGFVLFLVSEAFFFIRFFWAFIHIAVGTWREGDLFPPKGIKPINPFKAPMVNTAVLIGSGFRVTWAHYGIRALNRKEAIKGLRWTLLLAVYFLYVQLGEYKSATFTIRDSVYGSCFYLMTGFHGLHVIVGAVFLGVNLCRTYIHHFGPGIAHVGFELAVWYWHFVDVVWILLWLVVYIWGRWC